MAPRLDLQELLVDLLGSENVYFQPPPSHLIEYPCIIYNRSSIRSRHADNFPYKLDDEYTITVIDANPDSDIPRKIALLPRCIFDRNFRSDNLNHDVFNILF